MKKLSFLIPAYNQSGDLEKCIASIVSYLGNDIEIVVNDDCCEENLQDVVLRFNDPRIRICRNDQNLGLDGNILAGIENCNGEFIFLLRTTDYVIPEAIPHIIDIIKNNPSVVYITGTSIDDDGLPVNIYDEGIINQGEDALLAHCKLHFHPSGSLFRKDRIDLALYKSYWLQFKWPKIYFMVDQLMRLKLAQLGDFYFINRPIWIYMDTSRKVKKSVHNNSRIYDQEVTYYRYLSEQYFITNEFDDELSVLRRTKSLEMWLNIATWSYLDLMNDEGSLRHYGIPKKAVNIETERNRFLELVEKTENDLGYSEEEYFIIKRQIVEDNIAFESKYRQAISSRETAIITSKEAVALLNMICNEKSTLKNLLLKKGYERIGVYGLGYLGRFLWNIMCDCGVNPVFVADKKFTGITKLNDSTSIISPAEISKYKVDVIFITPLQFSDEIIRELTIDGMDVTAITVMDLLNDIRI